MQLDSLLLDAESECANGNAFETIRHFKLDHTKNMIISHYNINSISNKFVEIYPFLTDFDIDIFGISETKIDQSFHLAQFATQNYMLYKCGVHQYMCTLLPVGSGMFSAVALDAGLFYWSSLAVCTFIIK